MLRRYVLALMLLFVATPQQAAGYALNAHVAICQHVLDVVKRGSPQWKKFGIPDLTPRSANVHDNRSPDPKKGVKSGRAGGGYFKAIVPNSAIRRIVLANPAEFRAGCGAPDAFPFFGNTDPSHSYGWDPVGIAETLLKHARTDAEKSWTYGYFAHLAMDGAVHAFANTYAAYSMKRHGKLRGTLRPQVWNTFIPSNFLGHVASETWLNRYFIYAANPKDYKTQTPMDFVRRMFFAPGSPIVRHFTNILKNWSPEAKRKLGRRYDLHTDVGGEKPGVLGTYFHRALEHLHKFEEIHTRSGYKWEGHTKHYEREKGFKYYLASTFMRWHKGRVAKIRNIYSTWLATTIKLQDLVSSRGSAADLAKAMLPMHRAVSDYLAIGLLDALHLPPKYQRALDFVRGFMNKISEVVKAIVMEVVKQAIQPFLKQIEEIAKVAMGLLLDKYMDRKARDHARALLAKAGLVGNPSASEPMAPPATNAGIGGRNAAAIKANRAKLLAYPFYRNAWVSVVAVLNKPTSIRNLPSADFSNGGRCTDFFQSTRSSKPFTAIHKGTDTLYNATTEDCHTPNVTKLTDTSFVDIDFDKKYQHLAKPNGYAELDAVTLMLGRFKDAAIGAGRWLWGKLEPLLPNSVKNALAKVGSALAAIGGAVGSIIGGPGSIGDNIKAFLLRLINAHMPRIDQCVPDYHINKMHPLRPIKTCELVDALLKEKCTGPFLNGIFDAALPLHLEIGKTNLISDRKVKQAIKGIRLGLERLHVVIPPGNTNRPTAEIEISLNKVGVSSELRFRTKLAAEIKSTCNNRESAFLIRPQIDDLGASMKGLPTWILTALGKVALATVKFEGWKPTLNRWWVSKNPPPAAPPSKPIKCTLKVGGAR